MYTQRTKDILSSSADAFIDLKTDLQIEYVHLRGAMFGFYKKGSNVTKVNGRWPDKGMQLMKPGKLFRMLDGNKAYSDKDVEKLVNNIKSYISIYGDEHGEGIESPHFSIVTGEMIGHYYLDANYAYVPSSSNLSGSCMRHESCQQYFKLYEENTDAVSMLILRNSDYKIVARALLWYDGRNTYMDTIYHINDACRESMLSYAKKHGFYYKAQQSCHYFAFDMLNGERIDAEIVKIPINIDESWSSFPWLDTVMYIVRNGDEYYATNCVSTKDMGAKLYQFRCTSGPSMNSGSFTVNDEKYLNSEVAFELLYRNNYSDKVKAFISEKGITDNEIKIHSRSWRDCLMYSVISDTDISSREYRKFFRLQGASSTNSEGQVYIEYMDDYYDEEDCVVDARGNWIHNDDAVEVNGEWYHRDDDDIVYIRSRSDYAHREDVNWVESRNEYFYISDTTYCEYLNEDIHIDDSVYVEDYGHVHENYVSEVAVYVEEYGEYYLIYNCVVCAINETWILKKDSIALPDGRIVCKEAYDEYMEENKEEEDTEEKP